MGQKAKQQKVLIGILLAASIAGGVFYWSSTKSERPWSHAVFRTPQGGELRLDALRGEMVLVHFWAAWCAPCTEEIPRLQRLAKEWRNSSPSLHVKVLAVSLDADWKESLRVLKQGENHDGWVNAWDPSMKNAELFGSFQFPETYVLDTQGRLISKWVGPQNWENKDVRAFLSNAFQQSQKQSSSP